MSLTQRVYYWPRECPHNLPQLTALSGFATSIVAGWGFPSCSCWFPWRCLVFLCPEVDNGRDTQGGVRERNRVLHFSALQVAHASVRRQNTSRFALWRLDTPCARCVGNTQKQRVDTDAHNTLSTEHPIFFINPRGIPPSMVIVYKRSFISGYFRALFGDFQSTLVKTQIDNISALFTRNGHLHRHHWKATAVGHRVWVFFFV